MPRPRSEPSQASSSTSTDNSCCRNPRSTIRRRMEAWNPASTRRTLSHAHARSGYKANVFFRVALRTDDVFFDFANLVKYVVRRAATRTFIVICRHIRTPSALVTNCECCEPVCYMHQYTKGVRNLRISPPFSAWIELVGRSRLSLFSKGVPFVIPLKRVHWS